MYCTIVILCLECFHCYVIIIDCLLTSFDMLYFSTDGCINKSLTYSLTYLNEWQNLWFRTMDHVKHLFNQIGVFLNFAKLIRVCLI